MFEWKVENNALNTERQRNCFGRYINRYIFRAESETSEEDMIAFIDSLTDGAMSYTIKLANKLDEDRKTMPVDRWKDIKTVSLQAWLKRNDTRNVASRDSVGLGKVFIRFNPEIITTSVGFELRFIQNMYQKGGYDSHESYIAEAFHCVLDKLCYEEKKYFNEHDERAILERKAVNVLERYGSFGAHITWGSCGIRVCSNEEEKARKLTTEELNALVEKAERMDALYNELSQNPISF